MLRIILQGDASFFSCLIVPRGFNILMARKNANTDLPLLGFFLKFTNLETEHRAIKLNSQAIREQRGDGVK